MTYTDSSNIDSRHVPLKGAVNFRDIGGNPAANNRLVKTGLVYRSDHLSRLEADDLEMLQRLKFKNICDLRSRIEQQRSPDVVPEDGSIRLISVPVQSRIFDPATAMDRIKAGDDKWLSIDFVSKLYLSYLEDFGPVWGKIFRLVSSLDNLPLVFHCTGGKDRTGILAALFLKFLGVEEERILFDHTLSNVYNAERIQPIYDKFKALGIGPEKAATFLQAPPEPLVATLDHLNKRYDTIEDYLRTKAGLDSSTLQAVQTVLLL